ncbi:hypothetical protein QR98_0069980 [Sarcoptes scabiei]|uniref:Uncharacterized protein n=1 Tax=Sarcoptes scabiei TaxID=52283 RepID=A0A132AC46_SARSC|nr:hypothetical protein QR98_0069980 [Sarcoptes scabiei]
MVSRISLFFLKHYTLLIGELADGIDWIFVSLEALQICTSLKVPGVLKSNQIAVIGIHKTEDDATANPR